MSNYRFHSKNIITETINEIEKLNSEKFQIITNSNDLDSIIERIIDRFYDGIKSFADKLDDKENHQSDISNDKINKIILIDVMRKKLAKFKSINLHQSEFDNFFDNCVGFLNREFDYEINHSDSLGLFVDKFDSFHSFIVDQLSDIDNSESILSLEFENVNLKRSLDEVNSRNRELEIDYRRLNEELIESRICIDQINRDLEEQMSDCFELRSRIDTANRLEIDYRQSIGDLIGKFGGKKSVDIENRSVAELIELLSDRIDGRQSVLNECLGGAGADLMDDSIIDLDLFQAGSICLKEQDEDDNDDSSITDQNKSKKAKSKLPKLCPNRRKSHLDQNNSFLGSFQLNNSQNESFSLSEELDKLDWDEYDKLELLVEKSFSIFTDSIVNISPFVDKNHLNKLTQTTKEFCQILTSKVKNVQMKKVDLNSTCVFEKLEQELQQEICISDLREQVSVLLTEKENILLENGNTKEQNQQLAETLNESFDVIRAFIETINDFYEKKCQEININSTLSGDKDTNPLQCKSEYLEKVIYARNKLKEIENNLKLFSIDYSDKVKLIDNLKNDLNATNQKLIDLQLAIDNTQIENSQFRDVEERKIEQLNMDIEKLNEEHDRLMDLVSNLKEQNSDLSNQLNIRTTDLETSVEDYLKISEEFEVLKKSIEEFNILATKLNEKNRIFEELLAEKTSLLEQEIMIKNELEQKLITLEEELKDYDLKMIQNTTDFQNEIQNKNELIQKLTNELNVFEKNENKDYLSLTEELSQLRQDLSHSEEDSEQLRNTIETIKRESAEIELELKNKLMYNISLVTSLESDLNQYKNNEIKETEELKNTMQKLEIDLKNITEEKEELEQIKLELESDFNQYKNNEVNELEQLTNTIQRLKTELEDLKEQKEELEQINLEFESDLNQYKNNEIKETEELRNTIQKLETELKELKEEKEKIEQIKLELESDFNQYKNNEVNEVEELTNTIQRLKTELKELKEEKEKIEQIKLELESDFNQYKNNEVNEVEELTNTIQRLETELKELKEEKEKIEQIKLELESKNENLLLSVKKFELMKEANQFLDESIEAANNNYQDEISFLQSEITNKDHIIQEMKDYLELKNIELKSTEEKLQISELQLEKDRVEFQMIHTCSMKTETELKAKLGDYLSQMESLEANLSLSQNLLKEKENEMSNMETIKNHLEEMKIKLKHRKHKLTKLQTNFELVSQELEDLKMKEEIYKENFEQEKAKYNKQISSLKLKIEVLELDLNTTKSSNNNTLQEKIKTLKSELEERDRQIDSHKEALNSFDTLLRHYNDLKNRYRLKRAQFEKMEEKMKELIEENEKLKKLQFKKTNSNTDSLTNSKTDSK